MATKVKPTSVVKGTSTRKPAAEVRKENAELVKENEKLRTEVQTLRNGAYCTVCGHHKAIEHFYKSTDPVMSSGIVSVCRKCAYDIACRKDKDGKYLGETKASVMTALEYIDKPFLTNIWDASYYEAQTWQAKGVKKTIWGCYIKSISMGNYEGMRWKDSDIFKTNTVLGQLDAALPSSAEADLKQQEIDREKELVNEYQKNRDDVIKFYGYDPFEFESEADKPLMYSRVIHMVDTSDDAEDDQIKLGSVIEIVRGYNQLDKINQQISLLQNDIANIANNMSTLKSLKAFAKDTVSNINALAKESKLSKASSNDSTKGTNTWTGKVKQLKELKLREEEVNMFEVETCKGMQQVAELSNAAIMKQIGLDENDYTDMIKEQRTMLVKLREERNLALERQRILYRENKDLKELLGSNGIEISKDLKSNTLFAPTSQKNDEELEEFNDE